MVTWFHNPDCVFDSYKFFIAVAGIPEIQEIKKKQIHSELKALTAT
jgi:hypothetical protein